MKQKAKVVNNEDKHTKNKIMAKFYILPRCKQAERINIQKASYEFIKREYSETKISSMRSKIPCPTKT